MLNIEIAVGYMVTVPVRDTKNPRVTSRKGTITKLLPGGGFDVTFPGGETASYSPVKPA